MPRARLATINDANALRFAHRRIAGLPLRARWLGPPELDPCPADESDRGWTRYVHDVEQDGAEHLYPVDDELVDALERATPERLSMTPVLLARLRARARAAT